MYPYSTRVVFLCRLCKASFEIIDDFIKHKKDEHSVEFRASNCIIFEDILILNTNPEDDRSSMLSTVTVENQKEAPLNDLAFGVDLTLSTQDTPHDLADSFQGDPLSTPTYDSQNDDSHENTSYYDNDEASDNSLQENHDDYQEVDSSQVPADVSYDLIVPGIELVEFEMDCANNSVASVDLIQSPQNPYVLLKKLSSKEIQKYSRLLQNQETAQAEIEVELNSKSQCRLCLKEFISEEELELHYGVCILEGNSRDLDLYCSPCHKFFSLKSARNIHQIRFHGTEEEQRNLCKFKCHVCQKVYWRKDSLMHHLDSHKEKTEQKKRVKCDKCSSSFRDKCDLKRHYQAKHEIGHPFPCLELGCNRSFKLLLYLQSHLRNNHNQSKTV